MRGTKRNTTTADQRPRSGFLQRGEPQVWATGAALALVLVMSITLIVVVMVNGLGVFWPSDLVLVKLDDGTSLLGEFQERHVDKDTGVVQRQYKVGNRDLYSADFRYVNDNSIVETSEPEDAVAFEREEYGNFYGFMKALKLNEGVGDGPEPTWAHFLAAWHEVIGHRGELDAFDDQFSELNIRLTRERRDLQSRLKKAGEKFNPRELESPEIQSIENEVAAIVKERDALVAQLRQNVAVMADANGQEKDIALLDIVRPYRPNAMSRGQKVKFYGAKIVELLTANPRESNTEGGLFPAIFGTIMLVFLMSMVSFPLGVLAGVYLREYAKEGILVRLVRIGVNNMAGIPSIVYGIFGLGFFIYFVGGTIDQLFFADRLPTPTFGTGGLLWASSTLGLLTVPVVVVATDEALGSIPGGVREGSYALGATKFQTLLRVLIPMASPGIMTGFILAMARAAGEVAPLMITGVVKLAPSLPVDGQWPFFHFERKFMHLGFHIYDIGFQSPNVEAAKPMVFVTAFLLVLIVLMMSSGAIYLRNSMKKRYSLTRF